MVWKWFRKATKITAVNEEWKINKYIKGSLDHSWRYEMIILGDIRIIYSFYFISLLLNSEKNLLVTCRARQFELVTNIAWVWSFLLKLRSKQVKRGQPWSWLPLKYMCDDLISRELLIDPHHNHNEEICFNIITDNAYGIGLSIYWN